MRDIESLFTELAACATAAERARRLETIEREEPEVASALRWRLAAFDELRDMARDCNQRGRGEDFVRAIAPVPDRELAQALLDELDQHPLSENALSSFAPLAHGGMAEVDEAWDHVLGRRVVVKRLRGDVSELDPLRLRRFIDEARITGSLAHPSIVPVHYLARDAEGRPFFTMRRVDGLTLAQVFALHRKGDPAWRLPTVVRILLQVSEALAFAHSHNVIHRDVKPGNVMCGRFGDVYLLDWGIARRLSGVTERPTPSEGNVDVSQLHTLDGHVIGTPAYMAPEQARGSTAAVDARTDVYALGAMLYELLAGHAPYSTTDAGSDSVLRQVRSGPPKSLAECAPTANVELVSICDKAMARAPEQRYAQAGEFAADLRAWLEDRVVRAHRTGAIAEFRKWIHRNRAVAFTSFVAALLIVAGSVTFGLWTKRANHELDRARGAAVKSADLANRRNYTAQLFAASAALADGDQLEASRRLEAARTVDRGWEWNHLARRVDSGDSAPVELGAPIVELAASRTAWEYAALLDNGEVLVFDARDIARAVRHRVGGAKLTGFAWLGPSGRVLFGFEDGRLELRERGGRILASVESGPKPIHVIATSDDGACVVTGTGDADGTEHEFTGWAVHENELRRTWRRTPPRASAALFLPASHQIVLTPEFSQGAGTHLLAVIDGDTGANLRTIADIPERIHDYAFDASRSRLAAVSWNDTITLWDLSTEAPLEERPRLVWNLPHEGIDGALMPAQSVVFSSDGRWIISGGWDKSLHVWDLDPAKSRMADGAQSPPPRSNVGIPAVEHFRQFGGHRDRITGVEQLPNGQTLSSSLDGTLRFWRFDGNPGRMEALHPWWITGICFSPDESWIATTCRDSAVRVLDSKTLREVRCVDDGEERIGAWDVAWSPDSRMLGVARAHYPVQHQGQVGGGIDIFEPFTSSRLTQIDTGGFDVLRIDFSPDSERIAGATSDGHARIWSVHGGDPQVELSGHTAGRISDVQFSPDGSRVATSSFDGTVRIWDARTGECELVFAEHRLPVRTARWSRDGTRIVSCGAAYDHTVHSTTLVWNASTGEVELELVGHELGVLAAAWSPDGARIATGEENGKIKLWDALTGDNVLTLRGSDAWVGELAWSPSGANLASGGADSTLRVWSTH